MSRIRMKIVLIDASRRAESSGIIRVRIFVNAAPAFDW